MSEDLSAPIRTTELQIVDANGTPRILLSADDGKPSIRLIKTDGTDGASLRLDSDGRPALSFENVLPNAPTAIFEIDDKGAHVKLDRLGGASTYLFLNNAGGSGLVFYDAEGKRQLSLVVSADGKLAITPTLGAEQELNG